MGELIMLDMIVKEFFIAETRSHADIHPQEVHQGEGQYV